MNKLLKIGMGVLAITALSAGLACAGTNPAVQANLYWLVANSGACPVVSNGDLNCAGTTDPKLIVTVKGLNTVRGWDVQLIVEGSGGALPASWQAQSGGCAASRFNSTNGSGFNNCYNAASLWISGLAQGQAAMYFNNSCLAPGGVALLWLEAAGAAYDGVTNGPIDPNEEIGLTSFDLDQSGGTIGAGKCAGNCTHGNSPVCIYPWYRVPCDSPNRGFSAAILDANGNVDQAPFNPLHRYLTYNAPFNPACPTGTAVRTTTWGALKKAN